jgi:hypothetical protein
MPLQTPHSRTLFHLMPGNGCLEAGEILLHPDNKPFVSYCENGKYGLEIGYHVPAKPIPQVIVVVGRDADLILPGSTISGRHFSFEIHPESRQIMFCDRSRLRNIEIKPVGFRGDGDFRQVVLEPGTKYVISTGGEKKNQYVFDLVWPGKPENVLREAERGYQMAKDLGKNPRWAQTVDEGLTELPSWYNTRLHTPTIGAIQRTTEGIHLAKGAFGEVLKAVDLDSGCLVAVKKIVLPPKVGHFPSDKENLLRREVKTLSSISHVSTYTL